MQKLSHIDPHGRAAMVNITEKKETKRVAIAKGRIYMMPETLALIDAGGVKKGEVYSIARIAAKSSAPLSAGTRLHGGHKCPEACRRSRPRSCNDGRP